MLGKFKRSLKEYCPICGRILEIRVREMKAISMGMDTLITEEYILCSNSNCHYEQEVEQKRVRRKGKDELI